ncbi:hypothetical protein GUJ93_ZPchr0004g39507 [Zizania palustris]|uniref:Uncharacterized protein n=1 Tax=Zizania palustris TaxID=103762 RepID=A0A8J5S214_ZIZPA|nr:hypothetical protein GUJ93_ZPchr0004g39507 [Zizania palustris]
MLNANNFQHHDANAFNQEQHQNNEPEPQAENMQWEQWPEPQLNNIQVPQNQEELSIEVSGLSVGLTSGSTAMSANNSTMAGLMHSSDNSTQNILARQMSPQPAIPKPSIKIVYSRRRQTLNLDNHQDANLGPGSSSRASKGKGIMSDKPSLQQFLEAATDDQVAVDKLSIQEENINGPLVPVHTRNAAVDEEEN